VLTENRNTQSETRMVKREERMPDGRLLIYYTFVGGREVTASDTVPGNASASSSLPTDTTDKKTKESK